LSGYQEIVLTDEQRAAVYAPLDRPVKVFAGAGTGKTTVLTHRYLYLIKDCGFSPERVLALTFTRKAAAELRQRVKDAIGDPKAASRAQIWNFDAFWWHLLQENPLQSGIEDDWRIVDETEVALFRDDIIRQTYRDQDFQARFPLTAIQQVELGKVLNDGYDLIPILKGRLVDGESFRELMLELWQAGMSQYSPEDNDRVQEAISVLDRMYGCYQDYLSERHLLDFGDVLIRTFQMLRNYPDLVEAYRSFYRYVLIDETQDTNPAQFEILRMLTQSGQINLTVVGDDKQSIYGFRGTSPEKFRQFDADQRRLQQNRRSPNEILDLALGLICRDSYWEEQRQEIALSNPMRVAVNQPVMFLCCAETREAEARAVAARIRRLIDDGAHPESIALLLRSKTHMAYFEQELMRWGIPFRSVGGSFYDRPEVKDGLAVLKVILDSNSVGPLSRLLERPPLSLGIREMQQALRRDELGTPEAVSQILDALRLQLRKIGALSGRVSLPELLYQAMVHTGVLAAGCLDPIDGDRIRRNCTKLLRLALEWDGIVEDDPVQYFARLLEHRVTHGAEEEEEFQDTGGVHLLTIHRAKGLEFDHVFWCDVRTGRAGSLGQVNIDLALDDVVGGRPVLSGLGILVKPSPVMEEESTRYAAHKTSSGDRDAEINRLHYVAVTRAKQTLTITCTGVPEKPPDPFGAIQKLLKESSCTQENWEIAEPRIAAEPNGQPISISREQWVEKLQPLATSLRRRLEAVFVPNEPLPLTSADLERYVECPRLLFWGLVGRKEEEVRQELASKDAISAAFGVQFGRAAHRLLMDMPRHPECVDHFDSYLAAEHLERLPGSKDRLTRIVRHYRDLGFADSKDIMTEVPWALPVTASKGHTAVIRGIVDRIHRDKLGWVILDYKTGRIDTELQDTYFRQLNLYRLAANANLFPGVSSPRVILVEIESGRILDVPTDDRLESDIKRMIDGIYAAEYPEPESLERCASCPFRLIDEEGVSPCEITFYEGKYHV